MSTSHEFKLNSLKKWRKDLLTMQQEAAEQDQEMIVYLLEMTSQQITQQISESRPIGLQLVADNSAGIE